MAIVAPPTYERNMAVAASLAALQPLSAAMAERIALAQSLPATTLSDNDCAAFLACDAQVQAQMEAWMAACADASSSA